MRPCLAVLLLLTSAVLAQSGFRFYLHPECCWRLRLPVTWKVHRNVAGFDQLRSPGGTEIHVPLAPNAPEEPGFDRVSLAHGYWLDVRAGVNPRESEQVLATLEFMDPVCGGHR